MLGVGIASLLLKLWSLLCHEWWKAQNREKLQMCLTSGVFPQMGKLTLGPTLYHLKNYLHDQLNDRWSQAHGLVYHFLCSCSSLLLTCLMIVFKAMKMSRRSADASQRSLAYNRIVDALNEFRWAVCLLPFLSLSSKALEPVLEGSS